MEKLWQLNCYLRSCGKISTFTISIRKPGIARNLPNPYYRECEAI